jgi:DNA-binding NtrC family response regulator
MKDEKMTMLVVDDEIGVLKFVKEVFDVRGWRVMVTPIGASIWPILEREKINVILLDIRLPDESGLDILKELKSRFSDIPVIIYTAFGYEDEKVNEAIRLGASGYVSKGVPVMELIEVVNNTLIKRGQL